MLQPLEPKQYTSADFAELARANGVVLSVGRKGECLFTGYSSWMEPERPKEFTRFGGVMLAFGDAFSYRCCGD